MNRFLINLRSLDHSSTSNSDAQHFSRFSARSFRVSDSIIESIGQPLDYGEAQADADEDADTNRDTSIAAIEQPPIALSSISQQSDERVAGPSHTQWINVTDVASV
jgi:hypothetical protein